MANSEKSTSEINLFSTNNENSTTKVVSLWNPTIANYWSLLFSPILGAWVQAENWKDLGEYEEAKTSMRWVYFGFTYLLFMSALEALTPIVIPSSGYSSLACWWMIIWYFAHGKRQTKYLEKSFIRYERKSWSKPLGFALLGQLLFVVLAITTQAGMTQEEVSDFKVLKLNAESGDAIAQVRLGVRYANGESVLKDEAEAVKWYRKSAEQGNAAAQYNLGVCYAFGNGVIKDEAEAAKWFRKAAEQGVASAQFILGSSYYFGEGVPKDEVEAAKWYRKAAEQGNANAQYNLGLCHAFGNGVIKDEAEAAKWYRKAAEQGHVNSQYYLGASYDFGVGVIKDEAEAVKWYRKAAEQGDASAQFNLGACYYNGQGVLKDETEAYAWLNVSGLTLVEARDARTALEKELTPSAIEAGQKRSKELQALIEKNKAAAGAK